MKKPWMFAGALLASVSLAAPAETNYANLKPQATAYAKEVKAALAELKTKPSSYWAGRTEIETSKKFIALQGKGEQFGGPFESPIHACRSTGIDAHTAWETVRGGITTQTPAQGIAEAEKTLSECLNQINALRE